MVNYEDDVSRSWMVSSCALGIIRGSFAVYWIVMLVLLAVFKSFTLWLFTYQNFALEGVAILVLTISCVMPPGARVGKWISLLTQVVLINALFLDTVYWGLLAKNVPPARSGLLIFLNLGEHALNIVPVAVDFFLNAMLVSWPALAIGLTHLIVYTFGIAYVYHFIYGGWLYPFLDFHSGSPGHVVLVYFGIFFWYITVFIVVRALINLKKSKLQRFRSLEPGLIVSCDPESGD